MRDKENAKIVSLKLNYNIFQKDLPAWGVLQAPGRSRSRAWVDSLTFAGGILASLTSTIYVIWFH